MREDLIHSKLYRLSVITFYTCKITNIMKCDGTHYSEKCNEKRLYQLVVGEN